MLDRMSLTRCGVPSPSTVLYCRPAFLAKNSRIFWAWACASFARRCSASWRAESSREKSRQLRNLSRSKGIWESGDWGRVGLGSLEEWLIYCFSV